MNQLMQWQDAFMRLKVSERRLVFLAVLILLPWLVVFSLLDPWYQQLQVAKSQHRQQAVQLQQLTAQTEQLMRGLEQDPNAEIQAQLVAEANVSNELSGQIHQLTGRYVAPEQMPALLQDVLAQSPGVQLKKISSKIPSPMRLTAASSAATSAATPAQDYSGTQATALLYRHSTEFVFSGSFQQLQQLLRRLEQLSWQLHWQRLHYQVQQYPAATLTLELETISEQADYLRI